MGIRSEVYKVAQLWQKDRATHEMRRVGDFKEVGDFEAKF